MGDLLDVLGGGGGGILFPEAVVVAPPPEASVLSGNGGLPPPPLEAAPRAAFKGWMGGLLSVSDPLGLLPPPSAAVFPACPAPVVEGAGLEKVCSSSSRASSAFSGRQAWLPPLQEPPLSLPPPGDPPPTGERPGSPPIETDPIRTPYTDDSNGASKVGYSGHVGMIKKLSNYRTECNCEEGFMFLEAIKLVNMVKEKLMARTTNTTKFNHLPTGFKRDTCMLEPSREKSLNIISAVQLLITLGAWRTKILQYEGWLAESPKGDSICFENFIDEYKLLKANSLMKEQKSVEQGLQLSELLTVMWPLCIKWHYQFFIASTLRLTYHHN
nr:unnamed protein product [Callosobruchus chinensis]